MPNTAGMSAMMIANNPQIAQATRSIRRLYVGNLPSHLPLNELALSDYFVQYMKHLGFTTPEPVLSVSLNQERTYCFVEFRSVADTDAVLYLMNGAEMAGRRIRISRPKDYAPGLPEVQDFIVGYPPGSFKPPKCAPVAANPMDGDSQAKLATIPVVPHETIESTLPSLLPALGLPAPRTDLPDESPSDTIVVHNLFADEELVDEEIWLDIVDDVRDEFAQFGTVQRVIIPRPVAPLGVSDEIDDVTGEKKDTHDLGPWSDPDDLGKAFVMMSSVDAAAKIRDYFHGKIYHNRKIMVHFGKREYLNKYLSA